MNLLKEKMRKLLLENNLLTAVENSRLDALIDLNLGLGSDEFWRYVHKVVRVRAHVEREEMMAKIAQEEFNRTEE